MELRVQPKAESALDPSSPKAHFLQTNVIYGRFSLDIAKCYIGATTKTVPMREATRRRKYKQGTKANGEPALRWWRESDTFWAFCPITIVKEPSETALFMRELQLIDMRQPELNAPAVWQFLNQQRRPSHFKVSQVINPGTQHALRAWIHYVPQR